MTEPHPLIGRTVAGRYTIRRLLGEGGMATVWVAEQDEEPREVALKIMNEELTRDRTFVRRFEREAKAASLVVHPNSVTIYSWGLDQAMPYIAMELIPSATPHAWIFPEFGCTTRLAALASRSNRFTKVRSRMSSSFMTLSATSFGSWSCSARYTVAIPPSPAAKTTPRARPPPSTPACAAGVTTW